MRKTRISCRCCAPRASDLCAPAGSSVRPMIPASPCGATNGLITPRASAATPSASSSAITASLIRRRFCFCWAGKITNRMSRQSPQRRLRSPSLCRNLTEPCGVCMPTSCVSATLTARLFPPSYMKSCSTRTSITTVFSWGWMTAVRQSTRTSAVPTARDGCSA